MPKQSGQKRKTESSAERKSVGSETTAKRSKNLPPPKGWPAGVPVPPPGPFRQKQKWTDEELEKLGQYYQLYGPEYCARLLGRTKFAVTLKADRLGFPRIRRWTNEDIETLKRIYTSGERWAVRKASRTLKRSLHAVSVKARLLNLTKAPRSWSKKDLAYLKRNYQKKSTEEICTALNRRVSQVLSMASKLGISRKHRKAGPEDIEFIVTHAGQDMSLREISRRLQLPYSLIARIATQHGIIGTRVQTHIPPPPAGMNYAASRHRGEWTESDYALLKKYYPAYGPKYTSLLLGRSRKATSQQAALQGIRFQAYRAWTAEEVAVLEQRGDRSPEDLSEELGRSVLSIRQKLRVLQKAVSRKGGDRRSGSDD